MKPPQGRIEIGWHVQIADGRRGKVVGERLIAPNGAWYYTVACDDGQRAEVPDYELRRLQPETVAEAAPGNAVHRGEDPQ
jgi:hypothetical protein